MENQSIEVPSVTSVPQFRIGDYVFAGRWSDADWCDPWVVGYVSEVGEDWVKVGGDKHWGRACVITPGQGESICKNYPLLADLWTPLDYQIVAKVWGVAKAKKSKTERKRPEFTFEDGITLHNFTLLYCTPYSKKLVQLDKRFVNDLIVVLTEEPINEEQTRFVISEIDKFLRATRVFQQSYKDKELRKKLKLYIKWLQSEMSKLESFK